VNLQRHTEAQLRRAGVLRRGASLLVAASGGRDSTVLAHVLAQLAKRWSLSLTLAHVHHGLRPAADAERDAVLRLAAQLDARGVWRAVPLREELATHGGSVQDRARTLRYEALDAMAREAGAACVLTAHHAGDQAETVLLALLRASGPAGLAGIDPQRCIDGRLPVLRPLLDVTPDAIAAHAAEHGLSWVEDDSNAGDGYRRNALRHRVLPALLDIGGDGALAAIGESARISAAVDGFLAQHAARLDAELTARGELHRGAHGVRLALHSLQPYFDIERALLLRRMLDDCGAPSGHDAARAALSLADRKPGARAALGGGWMCVRERDALVLCMPPAPWPPVDVAPGATVDTPAGRFASELLQSSAAFTDNAHTEIIDLDAADEEWTLRPWRAGDSFEPLGGAGRRKVSDALTDARIPSALRRAHPVLESGGRILWVCGVRLDARAAVTSTTRCAARITWTPAEWP
jgi:tRNA(Ile)-lysidine synthase